MSAGAALVPKPGVGDWTDALLTSGSESLLGAVRNYVGPIKTPYDKRDLVAKLEAFLRRAETRDSILSLVDSLDARVLGSALLVGPVPEQALKDLFAGELPLFDLGVRISNLLDRLLLFRYQSGGRRLIAVNPLLEAELRKATLGLAALFGFDSNSRPRLERSTDATDMPPSASTVDAKAAIALFSFLFHAPLSTRKGGGLTKRAAERTAALFPELSASGRDRADSLSRALAATGVLTSGEEEDRSPDRDAFARILVEWGDDLPYYLAACLALGGEGEADGDGPPADGDRPAELPGGGGGVARQLASVLAGAFESLPPDFVFSRSGLSRLLRIVARRARFELDPAASLAALEALGILVARGGGLSLALSSPVLPRRPRAEPDRSRPALVVEGAHALHLMPEAGLEDRLFVACVARPVSLGTVWSLEVERDSVRRAFAAGLTAKLIESRFESMSGTSLPQSFVFSLSAWEEEYRSLRLYRGFTLVADERLRPVIERSAALGKLVAERLAPGVFFLSAASALEAAAALSAAGMETPPVTPHLPPVPKRLPSLFPEGGSGRPRGLAVIDALGELLGASGTEVAEARPHPDPEPRLAELRASLSSSSRTEDERRELADRIERRLVVTERQIAQADPKPERLEAGGLDYLGKVRVIERALRAAGDRLEVLYRLPGAEPVRALLRPLRLDKNEKGLVLEAEDLVTGGPARVPLGAVSTVRRVRASLFGEDQ